MATNPYQQYLEGPAKRGIKSIRAGREAAVGLALIYAAMGASLGIVSGTVVAIKVFPLNGPVATSDLAQASASVAGLDGPLKTIAAQVPLSQSQPALQAAEISPTPRRAVEAEPIPVRRIPAVGLQIAAHKAPFSQKLTVSSGIYEEAPQNPVAEKAAAAGPASSSEVAIAEVPVPVFMIEGDATVADYDATTGLVETHEGRNFSIGTSAGAGSSWDDYSGYVHYRCDPSGNCTLSRAGVTVPHARMTT
jgi:hypothetical protein